MREEMLTRKARQSWSSNKVVFNLGSTEVATIHHSGGNGLDYEDALAIARQMAEAWNIYVQTKNPN